eukprot:gene14803-biopygen7038
MQQCVLIPNAADDVIRSRSSSVLRSRWGGSVSSGHRGGPRSLARVRRVAQQPPARGVAAPRRSKNTRIEANGAALASSPAALRRSGRGGATVLGEWRASSSSAARRGARGAAAVRVTASLCGLVGARRHGADDLGGSLRGFRGCRHLFPLTECATGCDMYRFPSRAEPIATDDGPSLRFALKPGVYAGFPPAPGSRFPQHWVTRPLWDADRKLAALDLRNLARDDSLQRASQSSKMH